MPKCSQKAMDTREIWFVQGQGLGGGLLGWVKGVQIQLQMPKIANQELQLHGSHCLKHAYRTHFFKHAWTLK